MSHVSENITDKEDVKLKKKKNTKVNQNIDYCLTLELQISR
jgi:hypothetical protein